MLTGSVGYNGWPCVPMEIIHVMLASQSGLGNTWKWYRHCARTQLLCNHASQKRNDLWFPNLRPLIHSGSGVFQLWANRSTFHAKNQELNKLLYNITCLRYLIIVMKNKKALFYPGAKGTSWEFKKVAFKVIQEETELHQNAHYGGPESRWRTQ